VANSDLNFFVNGILIPCCYSDACKWVTAVFINWPSC